MMAVPVPVILQIQPGEQVPFPSEGGGEGADEETLAKAPGRARK